MKTQLTKPARSKASYTKEYKQEALKLWRDSGYSARSCIVSSYDAYEDRSVGLLLAALAEFVRRVQVERCRCQFRAFTLGCTCGTRNTASAR